MEDQINRPEKKTRSKIRGQPAKYNNPTEMVDVIQKYFDETDPDEYTVTGLALAVGCKQTLENYQKKEGFSDIITEAKLIIENSYEISLRKNGRTGDIFALKNFGWSDKQEHEHSGKLEINTSEKSKKKIDEIGND